MGFRIVFFQKKSKQAKFSVGVSSLRRSASKNTALIHSATLGSHRSSRQRVMVGASSPWWFRAGVISAKSSASFGEVGFRVFVIRGCSGVGSQCW